MRPGSALAGYILITVSAVSFSVKGIIAKVIYSHGVDPVTLLALRYAMTVPLFWLTLAFMPGERPEEKPRGRDLLAMLAVGVFGFYFAALADFYGLLYIDATLERLILYTYPALVVVLGAVFLGERPGPARLFAVALTYAGLAVILKVWASAPPEELLGAGLVFACALVYSGNYILMEVLGRRVSAVRTAAYATTVAGACFIATWRFSPVPTEPAVWGYLALLAVVSTYLPILTLMTGIKRIGASRAAVVSFTGPVSTAALAYVILGETLDGAQMAGVALVLAGIGAISVRSGVRSGGRDVSGARG